VIVFLTVVVWPIFQIFFFNFGARSTQFRCFFKDKRPSTVFPVIGRSSRRCLACSLHVPESLLLFVTCDAHAPLSLAGHSAGWGLRWLICGWARWYRWQRVSSTRRCLRWNPLLPLLLAAFFWVFLLSIVYSSCFLRYSLYVYCSNFIGISVG